MNIELRFLQKAIDDKNFVSFSYENKTYQKIKLTKLLQKENIYYLYCEEICFHYDLMKNITILKERYK